jgi:hypothetical protein
VEAHRSVKVAIHTFETSALDLDVNACSGRLTIGERDFRTVRTIGSCAVQKSI